MSNFKSPQVEETVRAAIAAIVNKASGSDVRCSRVRFTGDRGSFNFAWVMVDHMTVKVDGNDVDGLWLNTNDFDGLVPVQSELSVTCALDNTAAAIETAVEFVSKKVGTSARVELLLQTDFHGSRREANYVGNSDEGFAAVHEQPEFPSC